MWPAEPGPGEPKPISPGRALARATNSATVPASNRVRHEFRARAEDLRLIAVHGDSMAPLLAPGDRILVDTAQRVPVPPGIFVIWDGLGVVAMRVEHLPHSEPPRVLIRSVSADYQAYERGAEEVSIIGRVIWMARRL
jgi:phage repressor protein C with HTH and peptisase S24 domain